MKIEVYGRDLCVYCNMAKDLLDRLKLDYAYYNITENPERRRELFARAPELSAPGSKLPQVFIDGVRIGGFTDTQDHLLNK